jgi:glycerol-3-phosphate acyltransferase PlsY
MTKVKTITNDIAENINTQKILFRILIVSSAMLFVAYIYLVGSITFNVIARKSLEKNVVDLTSHVNQLDLTYLNNINEIDKNYAISNGFVDVHQNIFATRNINYVAIR